MYWFMNIVKIWAKETLKDTWSDWDFEILWHIFWFILLFFILVVFAWVFYAWIQKIRKDKEIWAGIWLMLLWLWPVIVRLVFKLNS